MSYSELSERNFRRISLVNWIISPVIFVLFAWPYNLLCTMLDFDPLVAALGSVFFASPFMMTILHGHVTMALGALHRHHYYNWLGKHPLTYGIFFHPVMFLTRFRLVLLIISFLILPLGYFITF